MILEGLGVLERYSSLSQDGSFADQLVDLEANAVSVSVTSSFNSSRIKEKDSQCTSDHQSARASRRQRIELFLNDPCAAAAKNALTRFFRQFGFKTDSLKAALGPSSFTNKIRTNGKHKEASVIKSKHF